MSSQCKLCPLSVKEQVEGVGPLKPKLIIIGNYPTRDDERSLKPFTLGKADQAVGILYTALKNLKLNKGDVYMTYALRCNPFKKADGAKPAHINVCSANNLNPELSKVDCPLILVMGNAAMLSVLPEATGGVAQHRVKWHKARVGNIDRLVRVTFPVDQVNRMSLWNLDEDLQRVKRWNPIGSCGWFFQQDLRAVQDKLREVESGHI